MVQFDRDRLAELCRNIGIERLRMFGSAVRGDDGPESDVDLLVDFSEPVGFFELIRAEDQLATLLQRPVELLTEGSISRFMREEVMESAKVIFDAEG